MNARIDVKRPPDQSLNARRALAAARLRFAALVDRLVARWLERCATNVEAAQRLFKTDRKPTLEFRWARPLFHLHVGTSPHDGAGRGVG
jgi:hypothetical protein